ncbi:hypothetical protein N7481_010461 [Penicillium waksmanii]|uniref:uncharacterized protein n=1 Tax=Penicillium waksmanii TaxID=69791 RepID=UPI002547A0B6|nr:uncharacterized protein N7481_010461 [Penicillium waksmanii]KAJ5973251.1 hypothetical protein N7481_010461 [Penicillium waksmanii]
MSTNRSGPGKGGRSRRDKRLTREARELIDKSSLEMFRASSSNRAPPVTDALGSLALEKGVLQGLESMDVMGHVWYMRNGCWSLYL